MAHEIENMMYVGETPWHSLGIKLDRPPTAEEAIKAAGLDWKVHLTDLQLARSTNAYMIPSHKAVVRGSDDSILGVVGNRWSPLQNEEAFKFFDPFIKGDFAEYHTAGSLRNGQRVWVLARMKNGTVEVAKNDPVESYLLLSNCHGGKVSLNVGFTPIRVVCNNTLTAAEAAGAKTFLRVMHRGDVAGTLEDVQKTIDIANKTFKVTMEIYNKLAKIKVDNLDQYIIKVLKPKFEIVDETTDEEIVENLPRATEKVKELFETGRGQNNPAIRGSYWAAYNAVTEWVDYHRGNPETRLEKAWFGKGHKIKSLALKEAVSLSEIA